MPHRCQQKVSVPVMVVSAAERKCSNPGSSLFQLPVDPIERRKEIQPGLNW